MQPWIIEVSIAVGSLAAWFVFFGLMLWTSRPSRVPAGPATADLGPEPPAVANILGNGWDVTEDAVEATLVDLAARKVIEFRQPADDPSHTTIHIRQQDPSGLNRYERRVFDRVSGLAVNAMVPLTALPFRDQRKARSWWKQVRAEIVADARTSGLSQRRLSPLRLAWLTFGAVVAMAGVDTAIVRWGLRQPPSADDDGNAIAMIIPATIFGLAALIAFAYRDLGERDTSAGRVAAARWLGLKAWLRGHQAFADLPPAAVATWDRYTGYGVALGASRVASSVIDLGMGNRRRVWSSFGGTWHRVRVSYPRLWARYGQTPASLLLRSAFGLVVGFALVRWWRAGVDWVTVNVIEVPSGDVVIRVGVALGVLCLVYGGYTFARSFIDAVSYRTVTGQVLWKQVWRSSSGGEDSPRVPWLYYLAVDDGSGDRTRAWGLPVGLRGGDTGDTVRIKVRRWSRRIFELTVLEPATYGHVVDTDAAGRSHENLVADLTGVPDRGLFARPSQDSDELLTVGEVGRALGFTVTRDAAEATAFGPAATTMFRSADRNRVVLMVQVMEGQLANLAWRSHEKRGGGRLAIGDGAWITGNRAVVHRGDTIVALNLVGPGKGRGQNLTELLRLAIDRVRPPGAASEQAGTGSSTAG